MSDETLVTHREFDHTMSGTNKALDTIERRLEAGAGTFHNIQLDLQRHSTIIELLQKNQENMGRDLHALSESGHPMHARLVTVETKLAAMENVPNELHLIKLALLDLTATVRERQSAASDNESRVDSWKQSFLRIAIPLLFALIGYAFSEWRGLHDAEIIRTHVESQEIKSNE